jgi:hypothetical protein
MEEMHFKVLDKVLLLILSIQLKYQPTFNASQLQIMLYNLFL